MDRFACCFAPNGRTGLFGTVEEACCLGLRANDLDLEKQNAAGRYGK